MTAVYARAVEAVPAGSWDSTHAIASVTLDFQDRYRRRIALLTSTGERVLLDLPHAKPLADGDGLRLEDGRWVIVHALPEPLVELRCRSTFAAIRLAWHLGNRHVPAELANSTLRIRRDPVIEDLARRLGADVVKVVAPFQPEGGAYDVHMH